MRAAITDRRLGEEPSPDTLPVAYRAYLERVPPGSPARGAPPALGCPENILVFDTECAEIWGALMARSPHNPIDKQIAAIALIHDLQRPR